MKDEKSSKNIQRGGEIINEQSTAPDTYIIPNYNEPINNPMIPNEQKKIFYENKMNKPKIETQNQNQNQILNLQLYQPAKPKPKQQHPNPTVFYPNYVPNPFDPMAYAYYMQQSQYNMQPAPIYKEYNINIGGVAGSHLKTAVLFEDSLPMKNISGTFTSLSERITMYEAIRSILFNSGDGKDVPIEFEANNLLSHLKLMDMNPYNASRYSRNPYKGLAFGFLLYRSCYPIRHDVRSATAICSANSTGVNVRIYRLTEGAYMINRQNITKASDYDEWRDMAFYNYIKEHIIKKKICPNFTIMYGYNITINSNINFDDLRMIQNHIQEKGRYTDVSQFVNTNNIKTNVTTTNINATELQNVQLNNARNARNIRNAQTNQMHDQYTLDINMQSNKLIPLNGQKKLNQRQMVASVRNPITGLITREITNVPTKEEELVMLNKYAGKVIVCLTEAANYSIIGWAKKEYRAEGNIKTMINPGYHTKTVWQSVIFQMLAALYVMQLKGIVINDFKLDRNVFIKDINMGGYVTNYWKYKIEGIDYYIPNYGYLILIDTNFRDYDKNNDVYCYDPCRNTVNAININDINPNRIRKLDGAFLDECKLSIEECIQKTFEAFRTAVDPNTFNQDFVNDNGVKPPEEIMRLLTNIKDAADAKTSLNIAYYIRNFMTMFMNNRIGGPLTEGELHKIKRGAIKEFRKGQIVVMLDQNGIEKFVIHVKQNSNGTSRIITKDNIEPNLANSIEKDVPTSSLNEYSLIEPIRQTFKMNESNLNEEALLETYNIE